MGLLSPMAASAVVIWTLVGSPLTAQAGVPTTFTLTATNEDLLSSIGCVVVSTTSNFDVGSTAITNGLPWTIDVTDSHTKVTVRSTTTGAALGLLQSVRFTVRATPLDSGAWSWSGTAYQDINCGGSPLLGIQAVAIVVTAAAPTPSPAPTATPGATSSPAPTAAPSAPPTNPPTPAPTARSTPRLSPSPGPGATPPPTLAGPSVPPISTPIPSGSAPAASTLPTASPGPAASSGPSTSAPPAGGAIGPPRPSSGPAPGGGVLPGDAFTIRASRIRIDGVPGTTGFGAPAFLVLSLPAILFSVPGMLLLILAILAQATGGVLWLPLVRRQLGRQPPPRRTRFSRRTGEA